MTDEPRARCCGKLPRDCGCPTEKRDWPDNFLDHWDLPPAPREATELEYLRWFYQNCDFGPAHEDVVMILNASFIEETGKELPEGYVDEE